MLPEITFNLNIDLGDIGLIVSLILGLGGMALAIYLGLHGFSGGISASLLRIESKVDPLANIPADISAGRQRLDNLWGILSVSLRRSGETGGTVEAELPNLGHTKVSATPGRENTEYRIQVANSVLSVPFISKVSRESDLLQKELDMFGEETNLTDLGLTQLLVLTPSTDAKKCAEYMRSFVEWLDTIYFDARMKLQADFERGILD